MNNFLYISVVPIDFENLDGVQRKVLNQCRAFVEHGLEVKLLTRSKGKIILYESKKDKIVETFPGYTKADVFRVAKQISDNYEFSYIRYPLSDPLSISLFKELRRKGIRIVIEIPTYPYDQQGIESYKGRLIHLVDKIFRPCLKKYVGRICTYSLDETIFGIKTINTVNGYNFESVKPSLIDPEISKCINLIAVSGMWPLHGYDRLIKGLGDYYIGGGMRNIVLHVVGSGYVEDEYKALTNKLGLNEHVIFYGRQFGEQLFNLYLTQALGVNSLAIHRENLDRESTLKTKEYAALGLPVISSSYVDAFSSDGNEKYVFRIPADESNVNVIKLINFADKLYSENFLKVRDSIREDGRKTCDMKVTLRPVVDFFTRK